MKKANRRRLSPQKWAVLVSVVLIFTAVIGSTVAFLTANGGSVTNVFGPSHVTSQVVENDGAEFNGVTKSNVEVMNTGDTDAYVRAAVVFTWQTEDGQHVLPEKPTAGTDYTIDWNTVEADGSSKQWFTGSDGYYYYPAAIGSGQTTEQALITRITDAQTKTVNGITYYLCVEILSSAIQAEPATAVESAWTAVNVNSSGQLVDAS